MSNEIVVKYDVLENKIISSKTKTFNQIREMKDFFNKLKENNAIFGKPEIIEKENKKING